MFTTAERVQIIFLYPIENRRVLRTATAFKARHLDKILRDVYVRLIVKQYEATSSVQMIIKVLFTDISHSISHEAFETVIQEIEFPNPVSTVVQL